MPMIDDAYRVHSELRREIDRLNTKINVLRNESGIAREAVDRFCPPELRPVAEEWLREKGL